MSHSLRLLPALAALALGCGDSSGLRAEGNVSLTVRQAGQADGTAALTLPSDTYIDPPPGIGRGFFGTCTRTGSRWTIELSRADNDPSGLRRVVFAVSEGAASTSGSAKFVLGGTEYAGAAECTVSATPNDDKGVALRATCTGLRASGDPRTVDATVALSLFRCETR